MTPSTATTLGLRNQFELHTLIAALAFYRFMGQCDPALQPDWMNRMCANNALAPALTEPELCELVERMRARAVRIPSKTYLSG